MLRVEGLWLRLGLLVRVEGLCLGFRVEGLWLGVRVYGLGLWLGLGVKSSRFFFWCFSLGLRVYA